MNYFDDESIIIEHFQEIECSSVFFPIETEGAIYCFKSIYDKVKWGKWVNSSGKSAPPPDFYSDEFKCMMDVMRVDDHSFKNEKGKLINPTNMKESSIQKELRKSGLLEMFPNARLIVNPNTKLSTQKDHNYIFYRENFVRAIEHHKTKIKMYRNNHQNFKLIFFVLDESSGYFETSGESYLKGSMQNENLICGKPHLHFWDIDFLKPIIGSDIDFLIWFSPFKLLSTEVDILDLPKVCVFDLKSLNFEKIKYDEKRMISSEI